MEDTQKTPFFQKIGNFFSKLIKTENFQTVLSSIMCALLGLIIGLIVLIMINPKNAFSNWNHMVQNFFYIPSTLVNKARIKRRILTNLAITMTKTSPLILTSLSILFAYKAGLFNIGAAGQYTVGIIGALYPALAWHLPWYACILCAIIVSAVWAGIVGVLKAFLNVNEVISGIMLNWIGLYLTNIVLTSSPKVWDSIKRESWALSGDNGSKVSMIPQLGLDKVFSGSTCIGLGIFLSLIAAGVIFVILRYTTFGYELKATGNNRHAAKYAGMKEKVNIILTLVISGALAGLSAAVIFLCGYKKWDAPSNVPTMGFDGISAAFLGGLSPIGAIFSSFFITHITDGGGNLDLNYYSPEIANLITAIIIYLCAFVLFIKTSMKKWFKVDEGYKVDPNEAKAIETKKDEDSKLESKEA